MPNPSRLHSDDTPGSDAEQTAAGKPGAGPTEEQAIDPDEQVTVRYAVAPVDAEPATEVMPAPGQEPADFPGEPRRRFTAPSAYDGATEKIDMPPEPATEVLPVPPPTQPVRMPAAADGPLIPQRSARPRFVPPHVRRTHRTARLQHWGWALALAVVVAALAAVVVLGTLLLTHRPGKARSQEERVRETISAYDIAIQKGDLATLRSITCGATRDSYVRYDDREWSEVQARIAAAKQYPVIASIDEVVVNGDHAEANVTTFTAFDPATRSTRSLDLQFRDGQWKICQAG